MAAEPNWLLWNIIQDQKILLETEKYITYAYNPKHFDEIFKNFEAVYGNVKLTPFKNEHNIGLEIVKGF